MVIFGVLRLSQLSKKRSILPVFNVQNYAFLAPTNWFLLVSRENVSGAEGAAKIFASFFRFFSRFGGGQWYLVGGGGKTHNYTFGTSQPQLFQPNIAPYLGLFNNNLGIFGAKGAANFFGIYIFIKLPQKLLSSWENWEIPWISQLGKV